MSACFVFPILKRTLWRWTSKWRRQFLHCPLKQIVNWNDSYNRSRIFIHVGTNNLGCFKGIAAVELKDPQGGVEHSHNLWWYCQRVSLHTPSRKRAFIPNHKRVWHVIQVYMEGCYCSCCALLPVPSPLTVVVIRPIIIHFAAFPACFVLDKSSSILFYAVDCLDTTFPSLCATLQRHMKWRRRVGWGENTWLTCQCPTERKLRLCATCSFLSSPFLGCVASFFNETNISLSPCHPIDFHSLRERREENTT